MAGLQTSLINGLTNSNMTSCNIIVNGEYFTYHDKRVLCKVASDNPSDEPYLKFFTIKGMSKIGSDRLEYIRDGFEILKTYVFSDKLFGASLPIVLQADKFSIKMVPALNAAVIESQLYRIARNIAETQIKESEKGLTFNYDSIQLETTEQVSVQEYGEFMNNFWKHARHSYVRTILQNTKGADSKYVQQLYRNHEFYKIMNAFIPVFIDCDLFFNPLKAEVVRNSRMYKVATEINRYVVIETADYTLSAYFLTQKEICKAFNMTRFMRFTPKLWYDIFMGLLYTSSDSGFPAVSTKVMRGPNGVSSYGLPKVMSFSDYERAVDSAKTAMLVKSSVHFGGVETDGETIMNVLSSYSEVDSLWLECESVLNKVTRMGACVLDAKPDGTRITTEDIYQIILEASL